MNQKTLGCVGVDFTECLTLALSIQDFDQKLEMYRLIGRLKIVNRCISTKNLNPHFENLRKTKKQSLLVWASL